MADPFRFELVTPERVVMALDAEQAVVPGVEGEFTMLAGHAPLVSTLRAGVVEISAGGARHSIYVNGGFAEAEPDRLTILALKAIRLAELDTAALAEEIRAAEAALESAKDDAAIFMAHRAIETLKGLSGRAAP